MMCKYKNLLSTIKLILRIAAPSTILLLVLTIISGLLPGLLVIVEEDFINTVVAFTSTINVQAIIVQFFLFAFVLFLPVKFPVFYLSGLWLLSISIFSLSTKKVSEGTSIK